MARVTSHEDKVAPLTSQMLARAIFRCLFDRLPVQISTSDLHHRTQRKKSFRSEIMILECSFPRILLVPFLYVCVCTFVYILCVRACVCVCVRARARARVGTHIVITACEKLCYFKSTMWVVSSDHPSVIFLLMIWCPWRSFSGA